MASSSGVNILINSMEHESKFNRLGIEVSLLKIQRIGSKHKVRVRESFKTDYIEDVRKGNIFDFSWNIYHSFQCVPDDERYFFLFEVNQKMDTQKRDATKPVMWGIITAMEALQITSRYASIRPFHAKRLDLYEYPFSLCGPRTAVLRSHLLVHLYCPHYFVYHMSSLKVTGTEKKTINALHELLMEERRLKDWESQPREQRLSAFRTDNVAAHTDGDTNSSNNRNRVLTTIHGIGNETDAEFNFEFISSLNARRAVSTVYETDSDEEDTSESGDHIPQGRRRSVGMSHGIHIDGLDSDSSGDDTESSDSSSESSSEDLIGDFRKRFPLYHKGKDHIHVCIDRAGCLPDNVTFTKIYAQILWVDEESNLHRSGHDVVKTAVCDRRSILTAPAFRCHCMYHQEEGGSSSIADMNGTAILLIKLDALEKYEKRPQNVGYSAINLFVSPSTKRQPTLSNYTQCSVNEGAFRVPIFLHNPCADNPDAICYVSGFLDRFQKLSGASLMVRISTNDEEAVLEMLDDHEYDDRMCGAIGDEEQCHQTRKRLANEQNAERVLHHFRDHYSAIAKRRGSRRGSVHILDDQAKFEKFVTPKMAVRKNQAPLNLKYFAKYNEELGLRVAVDGLHNMEPHSLYVVIFALVPPNTFWRSFPVMEHVHFTWHWDWSSTTKSPKFINEHLLRFTNFSHHKHAVLVVDVRKMSLRVNPEDKSLGLKLEPFGWSFFPLFVDRKVLDRYGDNHRDIYAVNGIFQNILFEGAVDDKILDQILEIGPKKCIQQQCALTKKQRKRKALRPCEGYASVMVSIYDAQRVWKMEKPLDGEKMDTSLIPHQLVEDYRCTALDDESQDKSSVFSLFSVNSSKTVKSQKLSSKLPRGLQMEDMDDLENRIADLITLELQQ